MEKFSRILDTKNHGQVVVILFTDKDKESASFRNHLQKEW